MISLLHISTPYQTQWITVLHSFFWDQIFLNETFLHLSSWGIWLQTVVTESNQLQENKLIFWWLTAFQQCPGHWNDDWPWWNTGWTKRSSYNHPSDVLGPECSYRFCWPHNYIPHVHVAHACDRTKTKIQVSWQGILARLDDQTRWSIVTAADVTCVHFHLFL